MAETAHADQADHARHADAEAAPDSLACRNCGHVFQELQPAFCSQCGQDTHPHPPSAWEFVHEFITHYVALEGKLWKTLGLLFFKPGELTTQFSRGRKLRYVHPLRLYITASFIFFLVVKVAGFGNIVQVDSATESSRKDRVTAASSLASQAGAVDPSPAAASASSAAAKSTIAASPISSNQPATIALDCQSHNRVCNWLEVRLRQKWEGKTNADVIATLKQSVVSNLPYAMFFMLPVFACLTYWLYWRRGLVFGEHMVYAMHVHALAYFSLLAKALLPRAVGDVVLVASLVWYFIAMQRFFGGRLWANILRYALVGSLYPLLLVMLTASVITVSVVL
jgi:hypothetical protein